MHINNHILVVRMNKISKRSLSEFFRRITEQVFSPGVGKFNYCILSNKNGISGIFYQKTIFLLTLPQSLFGNFLLHDVFDPDLYSTLLVGREGDWPGIELPVKPGAILAL